MSIQQTLLGSSQSLNFLSAGYSSGANQNGVIPYLAQDSAGNIYFLNAKTGSPLTALLYKCDSTGKFIWSLELTIGGTASLSNRVNIAFDSSNNVYVAGPANAGNVCLYKFDSSGAFQWGTRYIAGTHVTVTVDSSNNIYLYASRNSGVNNSLVYIIKYDTTGALVWQRALESVGSPNTNNQTFGQAVKTDSSGNIYVTGSTQDKNPSESFNGYDAFIAKYNSSGTFQWSKVFGTTSTSFDVSAGGLMIDSSNNIYVGGREIPVPGSVQTLFLVSFDTSGNIQSQYKFASSGGTTLPGPPANISIGSNGLIYYPTRNGVFAVSTAGVVSWANSFTSASNSLLTTVASTNSTTPGSFLTALPTQITDYPAAIAKLNLDGSGLGTYSLGGSTVKYISNIEGSSVVSSAGTYSALTSYLSSSTPTTSTSSLTTPAASFSGATSIVYI